MDNLCFGMKYLNITQLPRGSYSHANQALDLGGRDTGKDYWYARGDIWWKCTCCWYAGSNTYHFLSCDANGKPIKVHCADGKDRVVTLSLTHDMKAPEIGRLYHNEIMYQEGTKYPIPGRVTGNHIHLEIAEGDVRRRYKAQNGTWTLYNELNPLKVMFIDDSFTTVINTLGAKLRHCSSINYGGDDKKMILQSNQYIETSYLGCKIFIKAQMDGTKLGFISAKTNGAVTGSDRQLISDIDDSEHIYYDKLNANYFVMSNGQALGVRCGLNEWSVPRQNAFLYYYWNNTTKESEVAMDVDFWYKESKGECQAYSPALVTVLNGKSVNKYSPNVLSTKTQATTQSMLIRTKDRWAFAISEGKLTPAQLTDWAKGYFEDLQDLCFNDSGGSACMSVGFKTLYSTSEHRKISNALCFYTDKTTTPEPTPTPEPEPTPSEETVLKSEYDAVVKERDELKTKCDGMEKDISDLQARLDVIANIAKGGEVSIDFK